MRKTINKILFLLVSSLSWINANAQLIPQAYFEQGGFQQAIKQWQATLNALPEPEHIDILLKMGVTYQALGQLEQAQAILKRALNLAQDTRQVVQVHTLLSDIYRLMDQKEEAQKHIESAELANFERLPLASATILIQQGHLLFLTKKYPKALQQYQKALSLLTQEEQWLKAKVLLNVAQLMYEAQFYQDRGDKQKQVYGSLDDKLIAAKLFDAFTTASQAVHVLPDHYQKALLLLHLSQLAFQSQLNAKQPLAVYAILQEINRLAETFLPKPRRYIASYANGYLGKLYQNAQRRKEAIQLTQKAIFLAQEISATDLLYRWERQLGQLWRDEGQFDRAMQAYESAVEHSVAIRPKLAKTHYYDSQSSLSFRQTVAGRIYFEFVDLLLKTANNQLQPDQKEKYFCKARKIIEISQQSELKDYLQDDCRRIAEATKPIGCEIRLSDHCSEKEPIAFKPSNHQAAILYFFVAPDRKRIEVLLYLVQRRKTIHHTVLLQHDLKKVIYTFTADLSAKFPDLVRPIPFDAQKLYNLLIKPIEADLDSQVETLLIIPDDKLRRLPFAALYDEEKREFLVQKSYTVLTVLAPKLVDDLPTEHQNFRLLLGGVKEVIPSAVCITKKPKLLNCAEKELEAISKLYETQDQQILKNADFTKRQFSQLTLEEKRPYHIVHIASHGKFEEAFKNSYILTYEACLYMDDLEDLSRSNLYRAMPLELLTLSACETAKGSDRAALGLAGVAVKTGAKSVLASLWKIEDGATCYLMAAFYNYLSQGLSKAKALQRAQRDLLETPLLNGVEKAYWEPCITCSDAKNYQHPAYWAAFLLVGDG